MTRLADLIPDFIKPVLRPLYSIAMSSCLGRKIASKIVLVLYPESSNTLHQYWREPRDESNLPQNYFVGRQVRSHLLVKMTKEYASPNAKILEIGIGILKHVHRG